MNVIKDIAAIIGCIISIISLIGLCTKGGRTLIKNIFIHNTRDIKTENMQQSQDIKEIKESMNVIVNKLEAVEAVSKQQCRNIIKSIYYKYYLAERIPLYERKTVDRTYAIYHDRFDGNSYATLLYNEICKWQVVPISEYDEEHMED